MRARSTAPTVAASERRIHPAGREKSNLPTTPLSVKNYPVKFSVVTPSFRNSRWLKLCIASVADQQGVEFEHLVQDSCSDDGTQDWLPHDRRVQAFIEKDTGMYDAVNRGYRRAQGDIFAYLNCDEQYLPGALRAVGDYFAAHPEIEVALAGTIVVDGRGQYMCHRHSLVPHPRYIWFRFSALTSSVFLRRRVISERGLFFDTRWCDLGDFHWFQALMKNKVPMAVCDTFTSAFADTGENMNLKPNAVREKIETAGMAPRWVRALKPAWVVHHRLRRLAAGHFSLPPTAYSLYTFASPERRVTFEVPKPTAIWRNRLGLAERLAKK
jgi:glycosyltransferase involved in cell wall biosynthesis